MEKEIKKTRNRYAIGTIIILIFDILILALLDEIQVEYTYIDLKNIAFLIGLISGMLIMKTFQAINQYRSEMAKTQNQ